MDSVNVRANRVIFEKFFEVHMLLRGFFSACSLGLILAIMLVASPARSQAGAEPKFDSIPSSGSATKPVSGSGASANNGFPASRDRNPSTAFTTGILAFKKNDFKSAESQFRDALSVAPQSTAVLHNLALTEWKLGQHGIALALWRKALAIDPGYEPATRSIKWFRNRLDHSEIPHEVEYWETFRSDFLSELSLPWMIGLTALTMLAAGSLLITYFGAKRRARVDETPQPEMPTLGIATALIFVLLAMLICAKIYDINSPRGTILPTKVQAKSAPDDSGTALFDLYAGLEVQIDQSTGAWLQITYPGGPTGWIPASALMRTSDSVLALVANSLKSVESSHQDPAQVSGAHLDQNSSQNSAGKPMESSPEKAPENLDSKSSGDAPAKAGE